MSFPWSSSKLVRSVEKHDKFTKFCLLFASLTMTMLFTSLALFNVIPIDNGLMDVRVSRSCNDCDIPPLIFNSERNEFSIQLTNLFVSVSKYEKLDNVTIDNLCPSHSRMQTFACFNNYFGISGSAKLYIPRNNPLISHFPGKMYQKFTVDNVKYKVTLAEQSIVDQVLNRASWISWGLFSAFIVSFLVGTILVSFKLEGNNFFDRIFGRYTNYQDSERFRMNQAKLKYFNKRIVIQGGETIPNEEKTKAVDPLHPLKKLIATALQEQEEILSYEVQKVSLSISNVFLVTLMPLLLSLAFFIIIPLIILINFGFLSISVVFPFFIFPVIVYVCIPITPRQVHYVLTYNQFIVAEEYLLMHRILCINLNDISKMWASSKHDDNVDLRVELTDGKSGLLALVTDPQYYIETVAQLQDIKVPESEIVVEMV